MADLTGLRFGWLTVTGKAVSQSNKSRWDCVCGCGKKTTVYAQWLKEGRTKSCGCKAKLRRNLFLRSSGMCASRDKEYE